LPEKQAKPGANPREFAPAVRVFAIRRRFSPARAGFCGPARACEGLRRADSLAKGGAFVIFF